MREDRRSEPGLANGRVEAVRMQESIQELRPQSNPMLLVHPCCTNSGLRRTRTLPTKCCLSSSSFSPRSDHKGNPDVCAPWVHKLGPVRPRGGSPETVLCTRESIGPVHLFAIARALPSPISFVFYSLNVKLLFYPVGLHHSSRPHKDFPATLLKMTALLRIHVD